MKKLFYILSVFLLAGLLMSQPAEAQSNLSKKEQRKIERQKKKQARQKAETAMRTKYMELLKSKRFVFEADRLYLPAGGNTNIASNVNFLGIKDGQVVVQFDFPGITGPNGLGGFTAQGKLENWDFDPGETSKQAMTVSGQVSPRGSVNRVIFTLSVSNDGLADLQINMNRSSFRMTGQVVRLDVAHIFQGSSNFN